MMNIKSLLTSMSLCLSVLTAAAQTTLAPLPAKSQVITYTTSADGARSLDKKLLHVSKWNGKKGSTICVDTATKYQSIDGFGFAITYSSCYNLLRMSPSERKQLLTRTYSPSEGLGVSYARISIGCNDFSSCEYTLCDEKGLEHFSLQSDETDYVIPILKEILAINPSLKIIAAPWTCPKWMKVNDLSSREPFDSWTDGHLNPECRDAYAQYFVRFVEAMRAQGIDIYAVSPQNEPLNKANCASLYMPWEEQAPFVRALAGAFKQKGLKTKIYVFDHNYNYDKIVSQTDYPIQVYNALGKDYDGAELVVGAAYHDYGGTNVELTDVHEQAPDKELIFSETSIGTWNDGRNLAKRLLLDMKNVALGTVNQYCRAVLVWNFMLDSRRGPNLDGGCQTCYGAIDISNDDYSTLSYNSHYYIITHLSCVVQPGAVRVGSANAEADAGLIHAEFVNPDGTLAVVLLNVGDVDKSVTIADGRRCFTCSVPKGSVVSCRWRK